MTESPAHPEKFIVLGSNSFSGAHFVNYLLDRGCEVIGLSRSAEPNDVFLPYKQNSNLKNFRFLATDLNHDLARVLSATDEFQAPYFINFAAQSMVAESWTHPDHWFMTNVVSNVRLHDELRKRTFIKKYVHVSTPEVYGTCGRDIDETMPFNPSTPYAVSRAAADLSLLSFFKYYKFPVTFTRAANVYGPGQQLYRIIPRTMLFVMLGKKLQLHGGGHSVRSFIHIRDVAEGTYRVATRAPAGEAYHFSTPQLISIRDIVQMICKKMGTSFEKSVEIVDDRPGKDAAYRLDSEKAHRTLGWSPHVDLEKGIAETLRWMEKNFDRMKTLEMNYIHKP